jgi:mannosyl-glycoprotein endo-beta-N-acetylglucosaminidase
MMKFVANFGLIAIAICLFLQGCKEGTKGDHVEQVAHANEGSTAAQSVQENLLIEKKKFRQVHQISDEPCERYLNSIDELLRWKPSGSSAKGWNVRPLPPRRRILHCHDMAGCYCKESDETYFEIFNAWDKIDIFVYFSHHCITIPSQLYIDRCHKDGKPCLGTLITEHTGKEMKYISDSPELVARKLAQLAKHYGFDGYLINFESAWPKVRAGTPRNEDAGPRDWTPGTRCALFLKELKSSLKNALNPQGLENVNSGYVIYYDSLDSHGSVNYQNALTIQNKKYFDHCDGIFTNYWWTDCSGSAAVAGKRRHDVYVGLDCWARGTDYGTGVDADAWFRDCRAPMVRAGRADCSVATFAPGWTVETDMDADKKLKDKADTRRKDREYWEALHQHFTDPPEYKSYLKRRKLQ